MVEKVVFGIMIQMRVHAKKDKNPTKQMVDASSHFSTEKINYPPLTLEIRKF